MFYYIVEDTFINLHLHHFRSVYMDFNQQPNSGQGVNSSNTTGFNQQPGSMPYSQPTPQPQPSQQAPQQQAPKPKNSKSLIIGIAVIIVIIVAAVAALSHGAGSASSPLVALLTKNHNASIADYSNILMQKLSTVSQLSVNYSGDAEVSGSGMSMHVPIQAGYSKYNNDSRLYLSVSNVTMLGNITMVYVNNNTNKFTCIKSSLAAAFNSSASGFRCAKTTSLFSNVSGVSSFESFAAFKNNTQIKFSYVGQRSYNGNSCALFQGAGTLPTSSALGASGSATYKISSCFSMEYYIPLNMSIEVNASSSSGAISELITFEETSLSASSSPSITQLPGPVVNSTAPA